MNLHQFNVFRPIVETGSFSKAASHLHIAQSAVSCHVKALEREIGKPLFLRYKTQVLLTEKKGRRLREHVDKIFEVVDGAPSVSSSKTSLLSVPTAFIRLIKLSDRTGQDYDLEWPSVAV